MSARSANEPARRIRLQPSLTFSSVPDAVFRTEHPTPAFAVEDREVAHSESERPGWKAAVTALLDQQLVTTLRIRKRIDGHAQSIARQPDMGRGADSGGCRIR